MGNKRKCCIYIVPFPYENAQRRITMVSVYAQQTESTYRRIWQPLSCGLCMLDYSFYRPQKDGKLSELQRERRSHRYSTLGEAGD